MPDFVYLSKFLITKNGLNLGEMHGIMTSLISAPRVHSHAEIRSTEIRRTNELTGKFRKVQESFF